MEYRNYWQLTVIYSLYIPNHFFLNNEIVFLFCSQIYKVNSANLTLSEDHIITKVVSTVGPTGNQLYP